MACAHYSDEACEECRPDLAPVEVEDDEVTTPIPVERANEMKWPPR